MRVIIINHHPDCLYYQHEALKHLGHDVVVADETLNRALSPDNSSSTRDGMFDLAGTLFPISKWEFDPTFVSTLEKYDIVVTIHGALAVQDSLRDHKVIMDIRNHVWLNRVKYGDNVTLITNHPTFGKNMGVQFVSNYVNPKPIRENPKYVTMINSVHSPIYDDIHREFGELAVEVGNNPATPEVKDDDVLLNNTLLFAYQKDGGIHYYAVNKALNRGIPVYTDEHTYSNGGFQDVPRELFIFSESISPREAYNIALSMDPHAIQSSYQKHHNIENTAECLRIILEGIV